MTTTIFVYGTLLKGLSRNSVLKDSEFLGLALCKGTLLDLGSFPGMISGQKDVVIGEVYKLSDYKTLETLDKIEGYNENNKLDSLYTRENVQVRLLSTGKWVEVQVYFFNHPSDDVPKIQNGDYRYFLHEANMDDYVFYIAYGSNLSSSRMKSRIGNWRRSISGTLSGYRLVYNKKPDKSEKHAYANLFAGSDGRDCPAVAYEIERGLLDKLDKFEGYPKHYIRTVMPIKTDAGKEVMGFVYIANPEKLITGKKASDEYRGHLISGYKDHNLGSLDEHEFYLGTIEEGDMISDKKKTKAFNRCINRLKSSDNRIPTIMKGGHYIDLLKQRQTEVINSVPLPASSNESDIEKYEVSMNDTMLVYLKKEVESVDIPEIKEEISNMKEILIELGSFKKKVIEEEVDYDHETFGEWGGAGLVVTSDPNSIGRDGDFVVLVANARPIVWLMHTLKDICSEYLTYMNKEAFFHGIAKLATDFLDSCNELSNESQFFKEGTRFATERIDGHIENLSWLLVNYDSFWEEQENDLADDW
jgi:gamma-glutamylcyclotransferase (GGCT)/AIG2-like uncharacterized protein YtfP